MLEEHIASELRKQLGFYVEARRSVARLSEKSSRLREELAEVEDELQEQISLQEQAADIANSLVVDISDEEDVEEVRRICEDEMSSLIGMLVVS